MAERTVTTVEIAGEEYAIRSEASEDYTLECARLVNQAVSEIRSRGSLVEVHKAAILAAMALADQLLQARQQGAKYTGKERDEFPQTRPQAGQPVSELVSH
mgnify:CR=1 FL=1